MSDFKTSYNEALFWTGFVYWFAESKPKEYINKSYGAIFRYRSLEDECWIITGVVLLKWVVRDGGMDKS